MIDTKARGEVEVVGVAPALMGVDVPPAQATSKIAKLLAQIRESRGRRKIRIAFFFLKTTMNVVCRSLYSAYAKLLIIDCISPMARWLKSR
jgi:hypothetical protein